MVPHGGGAGPLQLGGSVPTRQLLPTPSPPGAGAAPRGVRTTRPFPSSPDLPSPYTSSALHRTTERGPQLRRAAAPGAASSSLLRAGRRQLQAAVLWLAAASLLVAAVPALFTAVGRPPAPQPLLATVTTRGRRRAAANFPRRPNHDPGVARARSHNLIRHLLSDTSAHRTRASAAAGGCTRRGLIVPTPCRPPPAAGRCSVAGGGVPARGGGAGPLHRRGSAPSASASSGHRDHPGPAPRRCQLPPPPKPRSRCRSSQIT